MFFPLSFANGQPNNYGGREDCVHFAPKAGTDRPDLHPFNDAPCNQHNWAIYVCQAVPQPCYAALKCHTGYKQLYGRCYKLHLDIMSFDDTQRTCRHEGATLIEPRSRADLNFLNSQWGGLGKRSRWTKWIQQYLIPLRHAKISLPLLRCIYNCIFLFTGYGLV